MIKLISELGSFQFPGFCIVICNVCYKQQKHSASLVLET